jgi:putative RNA 2'-phosphotransferase
MTAPFVTPYGVFDRSTNEAGRFTGCSRFVLRARAFCQRFVARTSYVRDGPQISKLLALILRHRPDRFDIVLDPEGYASLKDVLVALRAHFPDATEEDVVAVVETIEPDKRRYTLSDGEIRANYGHSLTSRIAHEQGTPPAVPWHGTTNPAVPNIVERGLLPMKRQYVHLTVDSVLAERVGARRGTPRVIKVDAARAHADGVVFHRANDSFWLADEVAARYLQL